MMDIFSQVEQNKLKTLGVTIAFWITYLVLKAGYNLFFHPLRRFPGPKLAAIGPYYEFYFDVVRDGMFIWETKRLHEKYGPIVRVNANELHVYDPQYYSTIYAGNQRRVDKYAEAVAAFSVPRASLATIYHNVHRLRRSILNPYFSKASVQRLESSIQERLDRLCSRLECAMKNGMTADLDAAFAALTADIVSTYFYGKTFDYLGSGEFKFEMREAILGLIDFYHFTRFFPWVANTIKKLPVPIIRLIHPGAAYLVASQEEIKMDIQRSLKNEDKSFFKSVMVQALTDESIPSEEREINRLGDEGTTIIFAGTETTARALSIGMYHILSNKDILSKLRKELDTVPGVSNGVYTHAQLECLPYLTAIVQESLRLSHGPSIRLPRVSPDQDLKYGDWVIPKGTPVSQSTILVHLNPSIFPEPLRFEPERWIKAAREGVNLDKFITAFTKGTRQCLGINLAYAEIYLTYARLVRTFDMQVHDTTQEDTLVYHIRLTGVPKKGRGEVKVKIMEKLL